VCGTQFREKLSLLWTKECECHVFQSLSNVLLLAEPLNLLCVSAGSTKSHDCISNSSTENKK
jgi:hypothetical protein